MSFPCLLFFAGESASSRDEFLLHDINEHHMCLGWWNLSVSFLMPSVPSLVTFDSPLMANEAHGFSASTSFFKFHLHHVRKSENSPSQLCLHIRTIFIASSRDLLAFLDALERLQGSSALIPCWNLHFEPLMGLGPYSAPIKKAKKEIKELAKKINNLCGMCTLFAAQVLGLLR
ncbi:hypothetical protein CARUB_v10012776mg [Capsella rubella]|uniref:Uncharacterized protein n=1 Tax=Capsella rubella TaxID=81985 RepID=R0ET20_9BRAS|nr:hypothetical protein CARUB_v10012776mg [Capsella rubella]